MNYEECLSALMQAETHDRMADHHHGIADELNKRADEAIHIARRERKTAYERRCFVMQNADDRDTYERALAKAKSLP